MEPLRFEGTVLLVEDSAIIALDAECMLQELGFTAVEVAATGRQALEALSRGKVRVAVLDVNLGTETSTPIAQVLCSRGSPFAIATGYGNVRHIPKELANHPLIAKPYTAAGLAAALREAMSP